tara:strand:+ start:14637 stop:14825 length:189 start_codon:yes stop_codon:yes gene_type:complete
MDNSTLTDDLIAEIEAADCEECDGTGKEPVQVCCGRSVTSCCGEPDIDFDICLPCLGTGRAA